MTRRRLYLATRSLRAGAPVLICPALVATTRSAMVVSSVSPERWETTALEDATFTGQRILAIFIKFAGGGVHAQENIYAGFVTRGLDCGDDDFQRLAVGTE